MAILKFNSYARQKSGEEYCSEVESYAQNMIEGKETSAKVIYPSKTEFATFRAPDYNITTESLHIMLPYPIYKIVKVRIKPKGVKLGSVGQYPLDDFKNQAGESYIPDVTSFFVTDKEWAMLPELSELLNGNKEYFGYIPAKSNTMTYSMGSNSIKLSATETKRGPFKRDTPVYEGLILSGILTDKSAPYYSYNFSGDNVTADVAAFNTISRMKNVNPMNWEFQIEYIPMASATKIKAVKAEPMPIKYTQVVNQRAEVNNAEAFGKYLHETAQKTGTEKLAIAKQYTKIADVPPVGALVTHKGERYRIVANSWNVTNTTMFTVTHLMSKNWSSKSKHVAVDQKYRNWDIPFDSYIWRTIYYEEYVCISSTEGTTQSSFNEEAIAEAFNNFFRCEPNTMEMRHLFLAKGDNILDWTGTVVSINAQGVGNSMVFSASMQDNISAGLKIAGEEDGNRYCKDVIYCNNDGTLERGFIILSNAMHAGEYYFADAYPEAKYSPSESKYYNIPTTYKNTHYFIDNFWIDKDPGEALKFTIQVHFMAQEPWIIVGNKLAQDHPFVNDNNGDGRVLQLWLLPYYIREGTDILENTEGGFKKILFAENVGMYINSAGSHGGKLDITSAIFMEAQAENPDFVPKCWVITDTEGNIYIGSNDINKREMYFTWKRNAELNAKVEYEPDRPVIPSPDGPNNPDGPDVPEEPEEPEQPEEPPEEISTLPFYVNNVPCWYIEGMTWQDWCVSKYNTVGAYIESGADRVNYGAGMYLTDNGKFVSKKDFIEQGKNYIPLERELIYFTLGGETLTAEVGMTWDEYLSSQYRHPGLSFTSDSRIEVGVQISGSGIAHYVTLNGRFVSIDDVIDASNDYQYLTLEDAIEKVVYINGRAYIFQEGMTWREFIDSSYVSTGLSYYTNSNRVWVGQEISGVSYDNYLTYNGKFVAASAVIVAGRYYNYNIQETDAPVENPTPIAPDNPWQTLSSNAATVTGAYVFNAKIISIESYYHSAKASFTSNGKQFLSISTKWDSVAIMPGTPSAVNIYYDETLVYDGSGWVEDEYRHIDFGGGALVPIFVYNLLYSYAKREYETDVLEYDLSFDGTYYVCNGFGGVSSGNFDVPDEYLGKPVKYINDGVFSGKNVSIGNVIIGNNVERIGYRAFYASTVTAVTLGNGLKTIGEEAFRDCYYLESIDIPAGIERIGARAFYDVGARAENGCTITYDGTQAEFNAKLEESTLIFGQEMTVKLDFTDIDIDLT